MTLSHTESAGVGAAWGPHPGDRPAGLRAEGISVQFEGVRAVDGVDLELRRGEIVGLIGPNGAGKTTLVNVLSGFQRADSGRFTLDGEDVTSLGPHELARRGVVRTFQGSRSFGDLSVLENVEVSGVARGLSRREALALAVESLEALGMGALAPLRAADLSTGQERRLQIARVIALAPRYLMLDEPAAGLNEVETSELVEVIRGLPERLACGVLLIDHDMSVIMRACAAVVVLDQGRVISRGTPAEVRADEVVINAYLGS